MQTYQSTPDYYNDYISHANHKYIDKHMGKNGKWIYTYAKNPYVAIDEAATNIRKKVSGAVDTVKKNATAKNLKKGINNVSKIQKNNREILKKTSKKYKPSRSQMETVLELVSPKYKWLKKAKKWTSSNKNK